MLLKYQLGHSHEVAAVRIKTLDLNLFIGLKFLFNLITNNYK